MHFLLMPKYSSSGKVNSKFLISSRHDLSSRIRQMDWVGIPPCCMDLLLDAGQEPFAFGQGQPQADQVGEIIRPGDLQDINAVFFPSAPSLTSLTIQATLSYLTENRPENPLSVWYPQPRDTAVLSRPGRGGECGS